LNHVQHLSGIQAYAPTIELNALTAIAEVPNNDIATVVADPDHAAKTKTSRLNRITKKSIAESFALKKEEFSLALGDIVKCGLEFQAAIDEHVSNAAIPGLAKMLGTSRTYFDNADEGERAKLMQILRQQCRANLGTSTIVKADKRTSEWHLLSRLFRQSDRRQASSDAKILKLAHAEGVTEESFASWVKERGTLSKILKSVPAEVDAAPKKLTKTKPLVQWITAAQVSETEPQEAMAALKKLADGKTYNIAIRHHQGRFDIML
jgi:hypothetical protein